VVFSVYNVCVEIIGKMEFDETLILSISDSTSIVGLCHHIVEGFKRHCGEFVEEEHKLLLGDTQVRHSESVLNVPSKGTELSTLKDQGVEEAQTVEEALESLRLFALIELSVGDVILVGTDQVISHSIWRLQSSFDGVLNNSDRELVRG